MKKIIGIVCSILVICLICVCYCTVTNRVYTDTEVKNILDSKGIKYNTGITEEGYEYEGCIYFKCFDKHDTYIRIVEDKHIEDFKHEIKSIKEMDQTDEVRYFTMGNSTYVYVNGYGHYTTMNVYHLKGNVLIECCSESVGDSKAVLKYVKDILK